MKSILNRVAAQPPSDFVPPPPPQSNSKKYLLWGCGGCSVMILLAVFGFSLLAYQGCEAVKDKYEEYTESGVVLHKTKDYLVEELKKGNIKEVYELMAPWYQKKTPYDDFAAQFSPYIDVMKSGFVRGNVIFRGKDGKSTQDLILTYIPELKDGIAYVDPEGQQQTLTINFTCSFVKAGDAKKEISHGKTSCPPALTSIELSKMPIEREPAVQTTRNFLQAVTREKPSFVDDLAIGNLKVDSFKGGGAEVTGFMDDIKKIAHDKHLYVGYRKFFTTEKDGPEMVEVAYFDEANDQPVLSLIAVREIHGGYSIVQSDLSKLPEKLPNPPKGKGK